MVDRCGKMNLIIDMLLTLCGRNLEISFSETSDFAKRFDEIKKDESSSSL